MAARSDRFRRLIKLREQKARSFEQSPSLFRELERPRTTFEQAQIKACLEIAHASGKSSLWPAGCTRGPSESAVAGHQVEVGKGEKIHDLVLFCSTNGTACPNIPSIGMNVDYSF